MDDSYRVELGRRARIALAHANLTATDVSKDLDVSAPGFGNYLKGVREMPASVAIQVANICGVSLTWLFTGQGEMVRTESDPYEQAMSALKVLGEQSRVPEGEREGKASALLLYAFADEVRKMLDGDEDSQAVLDDIKRKIIEENLSQ